MIPSKNEYIEKLFKYLQENDPSAELNQLSSNNNDIKLKWETCKGVNAWRQITSGDYVEKLFAIYEESAKYDSEDVSTRKVYRADMLIAKFNLFRSLKKWAQSQNTISILRNSRFKKLTEEDVNNIIERLKRIDRK